MSPDTINLLDDLLARHPILRAAEVPTELEIDQAEQQIGVPFPHDYREFLRRYGGAMAGPYPIFGLRPVEVMDVDRWSVITVTQYYRSNDVPGADEWVIISEDHAGNPVGIDRDGVGWIHDHDFGGLARLANNFEDYLRRICLRLPNVD